MIVHIYSQISVKEEKSATGLFFSVNMRGCVLLSYIQMKTKPLKDESQLLAKFAHFPHTVEGRGLTTQFFKEMMQAEKIINSLLLYLLA